MKTYTIPVFWYTQGDYQIKAKSLDEAIKKAYNMPSLPEDPCFVSDSLQVDLDQAAEYAEEEEENEEVSR
jgi:hypothetical protein